MKLQNVRLVVVQFSFSNPAVVPPLLRKRQPETIGGRAERKSHTDGFMSIQPTPQCGLETFLERLEAAGYQLVDAFSQERVDGKRRGESFWMVRFTFVRSDFVQELSEEFLAVREALRAEFVRICAESFWRRRGFNNPFYAENGEPLPGVRALSMNLEARVPRFRPDGSPVTEWQKDPVTKERVGDQPIPIAPEFSVTVCNGEISLV